MLKLKMQKMMCAACAALLCCTAFTGCGEKKAEKPSRYRMKTEITTSNSSARSIYTGLQSAITDLDAEDAPMSSLPGVYNFKGSDFRFDGAPGAGSDSKEKLFYRMYVYFNDITKLDKISFELDEYCNVVGVAVMRTEDEFDTEIYGTHPHQMTVDDHDIIKSMDDALKYAKTGK